MYMQFSHIFISIYTIETTMGRDACILYKMMTKCFFLCLIIYVKGVYALKRHTFSFV